MSKLLILISLLFTAHAGAQTPSDVVDMTKSNEAVLEVSDEKKKTEEEKQAERDLAQEKTVASSSPNSNMEKIEVTGSYIRRIDTEGPSPLVVVDKEAFEDAAVDTVNDYLREDPLFGGSSDGGNRDGYFRFHGQHAGSTLILINGIRVPKLGGPSRGFFSGVKNIPTNIIDRVEILKDGSSALYGSDAMAGVMNFITKKDYDGAEFSTRVNVPEIGVGVQQNHNLSFGKNFSRGNWFVTTQYVKQAGYSEADIRNESLNETVKPTSDTGKFKPLAKGIKSTSFGPACASDPSKTCQLDTLDIDQVRSPKENVGALVSSQFDITSDINIAFVGMYNRNLRQDQGRPTPLNFNTQNGQTLQLANIGSDKLKQLSGTATEAELSIQPYNSIGLNAVNVTENSYTAQTKLEGYYYDTWSWQLSGGYAYSIEQRDHLNGLVDQDAVAQLIANGTDPTVVGQSSGSLSSAGVRGTEAYEASMTQARLLTTGEMFDFNNLWGAGGPFSIAIGAEAQIETTNDDHDDILIDSNLNRPFDENQSGGRTVSSAFMELASYPLDSLEVQLAGRYDHYSDFGDTANPKVSIGWRPSKKTLIRTSWGTNFNAPSVRNMIQRDYISYERFTFVDGTESNTVTVPVTRYRSPDLRPERGTNYNIGAVFQPNRSWTFTADHWNFEGTETLAKLGSGSYSSIYEDQGGESALNEIGVELERDEDENVISARAPEVVNTGLKTIRGLDFKINFSDRIRLFSKVMKFGFQSSHSHFLVYKDQRDPSLEVTNRRDLEWKNTTSFSLRTQDHNYRIAARTLAGDSGRRTRVTTHTEFDFGYGYKLPWGGRFTAGVKNLINSRPPVDRSGDFIDFTRGFNAYAFQALGRRYYMGYSQSF